MSLQTSDWRVSATLVDFALILISVVVHPLGYTIDGIVVSGALFILWFVLQIIWLLVRRRTIGEDVAGLVVRDAATSAPVGFLRGSVLRTLVFIVLIPVRPFYWPIDTRNILKNKQTILERILKIRIVRAHPERVERPRFYVTRFLAMGVLLIFTLQLFNYEKNIEEVTPVNQPATQTISTSTSSSWSTSTTQQPAVVEPEPLPLDQVNEERTINIVLYFGSVKGIEMGESCRDTKSLTREIPYTVATADAAMKELLSGVRLEEDQLEYTDSFSNESGYFGNVGPLRDYYRGVIVRDRVAYVSFTSDALAYLNNTACIQEAVKGPIEDTLTHFPTIDSVEYVIDGEVYEQWDA